MSAAASEKSPKTPPQYLFRTCPSCAGQGRLDHGQNCEVCGGKGRAGEAGEVIGVGRVAIDRETKRHVPAADAAQSLAACADPADAEIARARDTLDRYFLGVMREGYCDQIFYHFSAFETQGLSRELIRGVLRDLSNRGLCAYKSGLWTEDGEPAGSGYGLTRAGAEAYRQLTEKEQPEHAALPHHLRMIAERAELAEKLDRLTAFLASAPAIPPEDIDLLDEQLGHMAAYLDVLDRRIARAEG